MVICGLICGRTSVAVPLKHIKNDVKIQGYIANVTSKLLYTNDKEEPIEVIFVFPLDSQSAVYHFEATIEGRTIVAECQEKEQARETYDDAVSAGQTAFLLEEEDYTNDVFCCKVGSLPPKTEALITFKYALELSLEADGLARFTLPSVLNPRYVPSTNPTTEAASISEPRLQFVCRNDAPYTLEFSCTIQGPQRVRAVSSVKDVLLTEELSGDVNNHGLKVKLAEAFTFDHDITLLIDYEDSFTPHVVYEEGDPDGDGILKDDMVMLNFKPDISGDIMSTNEFVFIVDCSGSMTDSKMRDAKETLLLFLKSLPLNSFFNVISFGSQHSLLFNASREYTQDTLKEACDLQNRMQSDMGGTEILRPLEAVYRQPLIPGYARQIFLLTDGEVSNTREVVDLVKKNSSLARVFTFGIGEGASTALVKGIAMAGNGRGEFISSQDRLQTKVMSVLKSAMLPSAKDFQLRFRKIAGPITQFPTAVPQEFVGGRLIMYAMLHHGQTQRGKDAVAYLSGTIGNNKEEYKLKFKMASTVNDPSYPVHRLAARAFIEEKELQGNDDLKEQVVLISRASNILSRYTSLVGVDSQTKVKVIEAMSGYGVGVKAQRRELSWGSCDSSDEELAWGSCDSSDEQLLRRKFSLKKKKEASTSAHSDATRWKGLTTVPMEASTSALSDATHWKGLTTELDRGFCDSSDECCRAPPPRVEELSVGNDPIEIRKPSALTAMVLLQSFDGSWTLDAQLASTLGLDMKFLRDSAPIKDDKIWGTVLALAWLETNFLPQKAEWEMIYTKGLRWLKGQNLQGKSIEDLLQSARKI